MTHSKILCIDAGGTFFKYVLYDKIGNQIGNIQQIASHSNEDADSIINVYKEIISQYGDEISDIGISTPGPFDYVNAKSLMTHKFQSLYGIDLRSRISQFTDASIFFVSDSNAFALGEYDEELRKKHKNIFAITIGTGLGMSVIYDGKLLKSETGGVKEVVFTIPYMNGIIEDVVSARGVSALYGKNYSAKEVGDLAEKGDMKALNAYKEMGKALGIVMKPFVEKYNATAIVIGGQISKSLDIFRDDIAKQIDVDILKSKYENSAMRGLYIECTNNNR